MGGGSRLRTKRAVGPTSKLRLGGGRGWNRHPERTGTAARKGLQMEQAVPPISGLYAGIKFFLIDFIFKRCPRLRAKYDTPYIIWRSLPTDPQLKERSSAAVSRRVSSDPSFGGGRSPGPQFSLQTTSSRSYVPSSTPAGLGKEEDAGRFHSTKKGNFHEIFNLTENERPLAGTWAVNLRLKAGGGTLWVALGQARGALRRAFTSRCPGSRQSAQESGFMRIPRAAGDVGMPVGEPTHPVARPLTAGGLLGTQSRARHRPAGHGQGVCPGSIMSGDR
ncbi:hypothetical protein P7K49_003212 [Saguinus oedipus]|uniref:Uncharacterized protein n=1 Tax=Saguinus oedipus TaxID=9490 RepID=A0ABQ9WJI6_SAGOE|nr:hypothetical protein P7K49_003212 [Saguinus oedipus]